MVTLLKRDFLESNFKMKYNKKFGSRVKALCLEAMIATNLTVLALPTETSINTSITPTPALSGEYFDRGLK